MTGAESSARRIDTSKPHPARVYDWLLDGKDNYLVDEELGKKLLALTGDAKRGAKHNRDFMRRATQWLSNSVGIRQFLDIGTGIPTEPNLHQVAQSVEPTARVVYVDNDPIVLAHACALLKGTPQGRIQYIESDIREPSAILEQARNTLDFDEPIALSLISVLHFIAEHEGAYDHVRTLMDALPPGSHLVLSHLTADGNEENMRRATRAYTATGISLAHRPLAEVQRFFTGLDLIDPGVVVIERWHPELAGDEEQHDGVASFYAAVGRKP